MKDEVKKSADMFVESIKSNPDLYDATKKMIEYTEDLGITYIYVLTALTQRKQNGSISEVEDLILKTFNKADKKYEIGVLILGLFSVLMKLVNKNMIEVADYIKEKLVEDDKNNK